MTKNLIYNFLSVKATKGNTPIKMAHKFGLYIQPDFCNDTNFLFTGPLFLQIKSRDCVSKELTENAG